MGHVMLDLSWILRIPRYVWGHTKAPTTFQHLRGNILQALSADSWLIYLDNTPVYPEMENKSLNDV